MEAIYDRRGIEKIDELKYEQRNTFAEPGNIQCIRLQPNDRIWRFIDNPESYRSEYWNDSASLMSIYGATYDRLNQWEFGHKDVSALHSEINSQNAICKTWERSNSFQYFIEARIKKEVIAYKGKAGPQKTFHDPNVGYLKETRLGGALQLVIPRFSRSNSLISLSDYLVFKIQKTENSSWFKGNFQAFK